MGDKGGGIQLSLPDQLQGLGAAAAIHPAGLEGEVFAVHLGQGQGLGPIVQGHHRDQAVGPGGLPGHAEAGIAARHLQHNVGAPMLAVGPHKVGQALGAGGEHLRVVTADEGQPLLIPVAHDNPPGAAEPHTLEGAQPGGPGPQDQHRILGADIRDLGCPVSGGQHIPHQQGLQVAHLIGDPVQPLVRIRHPHIFRLAPVDAAAQGPASIGVGTVVHPAVLAEKAFPAEGFHIYGHPVAGAHRPHRRAHFFHNAHHLVAHRDPRHRPGHRAVLDVQVAGADAGQGHLHNGVPILQQHRPGFFPQFKSSFFQIGICQHSLPRFPVFSIVPRAGFHCNRAIL